MKTLSDKISDAEARGSRWLADGNQYLERGNKAKAEQCYEKAQYWLDRANTLIEGDYAKQAKAR